MFAGLVAGLRAGAAARCAPRRSKATPPRPTSPTTWCARASPSATRTRSWRARCARPSAPACDLAALPLATLKSFSPKIGPDVQARAHAWRARSPRATTSAAPRRRRCARAVARARKRLGALMRARRPHADRQVPGPAQARRGRDLRGLPVQRPVQRARRGDQGGVPGELQRPRARQAVPQAVPHRGLARRQAAAPAHLPDLRRGGRREAALHRDGVRRRRHARALLRGPRRCCRSSAWSRSSSSARARSSSRTSWASRTATSSRPTSCTPASTDVKITDFGAALIATARDTTQVSAIGSPAYMSPEQVKEHPLDHRTDIYSIGVVMYHLLTGRLPFQAANNFSLIYQITNVDARAAVGLPARRSRRRSTPSCSTRWPRTSATRYRSWEEFSLDLAEAFRDERLRRAQGAGVRRLRQVRDAAQAAVLPALLRRRAVGGGAHLGLAPRRRRRAADARGRAGRLLLHPRRRARSR